MCPKAEWAVWIVSPHDETEVRRLRLSPSTETPLIAEFTLKADEETLAHRIVIGISEPLEVESKFGSKATWVRMDAHHLL